MTRSAVNIFLQQFQKILNGETGLLENATDEFLAEVAWMHRDGYRSFSNAGGAASRDCLAGEQFQNPPA